MKRLINWFKSLFKNTEKPQIKEVRTVPEGHIVEHKSKYQNKMFRFVYENGIWYGNGSGGQKIKETPFMQLQLTSKVLNTFR